MSQLTANAPEVLEFGLTNSLPVLTNTEIFLGSAVGLSGAFARPLNAGDIFQGFAEQHINNNPGASGALNVPLMREGRVVLAIAAAANTDIGKSVYASDGATFTYTATGNTRVGTVVRWISTGVVLVEFWTGTSKLVNSTLTDSTGGTPATTFAAIAAGASYAQADMVSVKNALSQIALMLNQINQAGL